MQIDRERLALNIPIALRLQGIDTDTRIGELTGDERMAVVRAVLGDIEAQGFVIVPRAPSENTQLHGRDAISDRINRKDDDVMITADDAAACWRAMIDAVSAEKEKAR